MKKVISVVLVIVWMIVIFFMSNMNSTESNTKSIGSIETAVTTTYAVTDKVGITNNEANDKEKINNISEDLNYPLRKGMHMLEYFILTLLLFNMFTQFGIKDKRRIIFSLLICFLYACTDEFHQLFTGRTSKFLDVLIDTTGGVIATLLFTIIRKKKDKLFRI